MENILILEFDNEHCNQAWGGPYKRARLLYMSWNNNSEHFTFDCQSIFTCFSSFLIQVN